MSVLSSVTESETDPLIRFADLSPARRGTAKVSETATAQSLSRSTPCGELSPKTTEGSVAGLMTAGTHQSPARLTPDLLLSPKAPPTEIRKVRRGPKGHAERSNRIVQKIGRPRPFQAVVDLLFPQPRGPIEEVSRFALLCPSVGQSAGCSQSRWQWSTPVCPFP
jgi:hypothetical protein